MMKLTPKLKKYIRYLLMAGLFCFIFSLVIAFMVLNSRHLEDWSVYYIPFQILGAFLGFWWIWHWNPGGSVTFRISDDPPLSQEEKDIDKLIAKYRSKSLLILFPIAYFIVAALIGKDLYQVNESYFEGYIGSFVYTATIVLIGSNGVKFLSAWWNIKKNWKKEFSN